MAIDPEEQLPGELLTAQDFWLDANIRHQIGLLRVSGRIRNQIVKLIDSTEGDLRRRIVDALEGHTGTDTPANVRRLQKLLADVEAIRGKSWDEVQGIWIREMNEIAVAEPAFMDGILKTVVPVRLNTTLPTANTMRTLVSTRPFEGKLLREWAKKVRADDVARIRDQIRIGIVQGEGPRAIARRVVGTVRLKGRNGVTQLARRDAERITRTAVNHYANQARRAFFEENADLVGREIYVATLDSRTTPICRKYDGKTWPVGEGPIPPVHWLCRSTRTAQLDQEAIGQRPMKPTTQKMLLREFSEENGLGTVRNRKGLPRGFKGKFDEFARRRTRELVGRVPSKTTYQNFLKRQSAEFQDDVLRKTKGALFRRGGLTVDDFVDESGRELTLRELAASEAAAFEAAGLDPEAFLR